MSPASDEDRRWLDAAVRQATPFLGTTADNPAVAALIFNSQTQTLVSRAVTARGGRPHAEALALDMAGFEAAGCTLYVTLEPCHHWSRTPPCVDAIIRAGIMRVVIGVADPHHKGAMQHLESAGVETVLANHAGSAALHAGYLLRHDQERPHVRAIIASDSVSQSARDWIAMQRARADAIIVGAATAQRDPDLTINLVGLAGRTPIRVVLAGSHGVDRKMNLIGGFSGYRTAVIAESAAALDLPASVQSIRVAGEGGRPALDKVFGELARRGMQNVLVEPGKRLMASLIAADFPDAATTIAAVEDVAVVMGEPLVMGGMDEAGRERFAGNTLIHYIRHSS